MTGAPLRGWQVTCAQFQWNMHSVLREHAKTGKRERTQSTGHHNVVVYSVTEGDPTDDCHADAAVNLRPYRNQGAKAPLPERTCFHHDNEPFDFMVQ
jgi:hypothetical protein